MVLKIAIQKTGRLHDDSIQLLKDCGIDVKNGRNQLKTIASNFPLEVYFLRDDDIPQYVQDGVADIGIVGQNVLYEKRSGSAGNIKADPFDTDAFPPAPYPRQGFNDVGIC